MASNICIPKDTEKQQMVFDYLVKAPVGSWCWANYPEIWKGTPRMFRFHNEEDEIIFRLKVGYYESE